MNNLTYPNLIYVLTVGHKRFDTRIWIKEIASMTAVGMSVRYIVADGAGDAIVGGVEICDFGPIPDGTGFIRRMTTMYTIVKQCGLARGNIVHFHDGIFLPFALLLWLRGCKVVYDVHEDYPRQIMNSRFPILVKRAWSLALSLLEWFAGKVLHGFIAATPTIAMRFPKHKTVTVRNFPEVKEFQVIDPVDWEQRELRAVYVGGLSVHRGAKEMLDAIHIASRKIRSLRLTLAGTYSPKAVRDELKAMQGWDAVEELGWIERNDVASLLGNSRVGLVLLHPTKNYIDAYPVKLFEYMSAGIPVIASDFPLWREIVNGSNCGLLVDPLNPSLIANAICWLIDHPKEAEEMGRNGRDAVNRRYNWANEGEKLLTFYRSKFKSLA